MWMFRKSQPRVITDTLYFIMLGQSNCSGRGTLTGKESGHPRAWMFGNDYVMKKAYEPVDDATGQVDSISNDSTSAKHSFGLRCAKNLCNVNGNRKVVLIPCSKGSTGFAQWMPGADHMDRNTLYGSANYRRSVAVPSGKSLCAILYFGHEANSLTPEDRTAYASLWASQVETLRADYGGFIPIVYAQLAHNVGDDSNHGQHLVAEIQRLTEAGSGDSSAVLGTYMVPTFDLPLIDVIHLDALGQKIVGDRMALAIRQHILGDNVNGTGPRLVNCTHPGGDKSKIKVKTTRILNTITGNADNQFRAFDNGVEVTVSSVIRDTDTTAALIVLAAPASGIVTVSYGDVVTSGPGVQLINVLKDVDGLPLPQFGLQQVL